MAMDTHPCFLSGDVAFFFNEGSDAYLHMTADEHDVGSMWRERNHWHTFVLTPAGPPGVPLRGGDSVWLVGVTGKCVDVHADSEEATSQPRSSGVEQQICLVPLRPDGSPGLGEPLFVGSRLELRVGGPSGACLQVPPGAHKIRIAAAGAPGTVHTLRCSDEVPAGSPDWADPSRTAVNRLPAHAPLRSHRSEAAALAREDARLCLSGEWLFRLVDCPANVPASFGSAGMEEDEEGWRPITVPSNWQLPHDETAGDRPIYTNVSYPWQQWPPHVPRADNPTGLYRTSFTLPAAWCAPAEPSEDLGDGLDADYGGPGWGGVLAHGERAVLCFDAVDAAFRVWLNGEHLGYSQDSRLPAEFDATQALREGDNLLAVQVVRWCDGSYLEDQDHWWLSGIHRDVWLYRKPPSHLADYHGHIALARSAHTASGYTAELCVRALLRTPPSWRRAEVMDGVCLAVRASLFSADGTEVLRAASPAWSGGELAQPDEAGGGGGGGGPGGGPGGGGGGGGGGGESDGARWAAGASAVAREAGLSQWDGSADGCVSLSLRAPLPDVSLWSAEAPHLYTLCLCLVDGRRVHSRAGWMVDGGREVEWEACRLGAKEVVVEEGQLLVNGRAVLLKGVNRHEHDPRTGKVVGEASMLEDIRLMKAWNFNAVRCSHYPNCQRWYELCDEYGLYVVDEANIETHGLVGMPTPHNRLHLAASPLWRLAMMERVTRMVERDKNHACVFLWSLGNEAGTGPCHFLMHRWVRARDPSRPVHYEGLGNACNFASDVVAPMYARVHECRMLVDAPHERRPLLLCEHCQTVETAAFVVAQLVAPSAPGDSHWLQAALYTPDGPLSHWACFQCLERPL